MNSQNNSHTLLRGVKLPSRITDKSDRYPSSAAYEIAKNSKPERNPGRSLSLAPSNSATTFTFSGFCTFEPDFSKFITISSVDDDTGKSDKNHMILMKRLSAEKARDELTKLADFQRTDKHERTFTESANWVFFTRDIMSYTSSHNEVTYDLHLQDITGIYFCNEKNYVVASDTRIADDKQAIVMSDLCLQAIAILEAVFIQQEFERIHHRKLPIYQYEASGEFTLMHDDSFHENNLIPFWQKAMDQYIGVVLQKDPLLVFTLSVIDLKKYAFYGEEDDILPLDHYYSAKGQEIINQYALDLLDKTKHYITAQRSKSHQNSSFEELKQNPLQIRKHVKNTRAKHELFISYEKVTKLIARLYMDEKFCKMPRAEVLDKLLSAFFVELFRVMKYWPMLPNLKVLKKLIFASNVIEQNEIIKIMRDYLEKNDMTAYHLNEFYELMLGLNEDNQENLTALFKLNCDRILLNKDNNCVSFVSVLKHYKYSKILISDYARSVAKDTINDEALITLMKDILFKGELFEHCKDDFSLNSLWALTSNVFSFEDDVVFKQCLEIMTVKFRSYQFKDFTRFRMRMNEIFSKKGYVVDGIINKMLISAAVKMTEQGMQKYINDYFNYSSSYLFTSAFYVPLQRLNGLMYLYSQHNPEFGPLPLKAFKLLIVVGIRILLHNPDYFAWYLRKIEKVTMPQNIQDVLDNLLTKTLDYYPDSLDNSDVRNALARLHPEFTEVLIHHKFKQQTISFPVTESKSLEIITTLAQPALVYSYKNYLSNRYKEENKTTSFPILHFDKNDQIAYSVALTYSSFLAGEGDYGFVYRSNHGLPHTVSTLYCVPLIIEFNRKHAIPEIKEYIASQTSDADAYIKFISKLQIAMAFYVSGREGEHPFNTKEYENYRKQSAVNFLNYIEEHQLHYLFADNKELNAYVEHLEHSYSRYEHKSGHNYWYHSEDDKVDSQRRKALPVLLYGAHCADLVRLWEPKKIETETVLDLMKGVYIELHTDKDIRHDAFCIFKIAAKINLMMGNSVATDYDIQKRKCFRPKIKYCDLYNTQYPKTNLAKFMHYANSPEECIKLLNSISPEALLNHVDNHCFTQNSGLFFEAKNEIENSSHKVSVLSKSYTNHK